MLPGACVPIAAATSTLGPGASFDADLRRCRNGVNGNCAGVRFGFSARTPKIGRVLSPAPRWRSELKAAIPFFEGPTRGLSIIMVAHITNVCAAMRSSRHPAERMSDGQERDRISVSGAPVYDLATPHNEHDGNPAIRDNQGSGIEPGRDRICI